MIKIKGKKYDKIVLLAKAKLNTVGVLISIALINSDISYDKQYVLNRDMSHYEPL